MHELGIMSSVMDSAVEAAKRAGADKLLGVAVTIGEMTLALPDALRYAWEALCETDSFCEGARLDLNFVRAKSRCLECGSVFEHRAGEMLCPDCGSFACELLAGREMYIDSIEVDIPDKAEEGVSAEKPGGSDDLCGLDEPGEPDGPDISSDGPAKPETSEDQA